MSKKIDLILNNNQWLTPNTYDKNFSFPDNSSGVYLLVNTILSYTNKKVKREILYVGSSSNLIERYSKHEVMRVLKKTHDYIQFFFVKTENYKEIEKSLIKQIQPKHNTQWR
jgi:excinuclease UvrABC nuclease subunit